MTAQESTSDGDITVGKSWRSFIALVSIAVGYAILYWIALRIFPSVPCSPVAPAGCTPEPTTSLLFASALLPLVAAALVLLQLPLLWQQSKPFASLLRWSMRALGLAIWLWLIISGIGAVGAIAARFMS